MDLHYYRPDQLKPLLEKGINLIDLRSAEEFCNGFIPDAIFVPDSWMRHSKLKLILQMDQPIVIVPGEESNEAIRRLEAEEGSMIQGIADGGYNAWQEAGNNIDVVISVEAEELGYEIKFGEPKIVDMRFSKQAYKKLHIAGAEYLPADELLDRFAEVNSDDTVYLYDEDGEGSLAVISFLKKHGLHNFYHLKGGFQAAQAEGLPMEQEQKDNKQNG
jgi:rhodanese-related sulfurtransferase